MKSPQLNSEKFGAFLTAPSGGAALEVWKRRVSQFCETITLAELFSIPQGPRQRYIDIMLETRSESNGFVLRATRPGVMVRTKQKQQSVEFPQEDTKVTISEGLIIFGKYGMYEQNELETTHRAGLIEEVEPSARTRIENAREKEDRAAAMFEEARRLYEESKEQRKLEERNAKEETKSFAKKEVNKDFLDLLRAGLDYGVIEKKGNWFAFGEVTLGNGTENAAEFLEANREVCYQISQAIDEKVSASNPS